MPILISAKIILPKISKFEYAHLILMENLPTVKSPAVNKFFVSPEKWL